MPHGYAGALLIAPPSEKSESQNVRYPMTLKKRIGSLPF